MSLISTTELSPPLKWAGGKRWLIPRLAEIWKSQTKRRLVEPFLGGGAVALGLKPQSALLNDTNLHLINFYQCLQNGLVLDLQMANDRELYYTHRARFNQLIANGREKGVEAASLFYYLNRTGYNGLCRFNRRGSFNVPFGQHKSINYTTNFTPYARALAKWQFTCGDFSKLNLMDSDFIYADPPYDVEFTTYSPGGFQWTEQVRLAQWLAAHRGPVIASNQATERILKLYESLDFKIELLKAPRLISCKGDRTRASEMLATKGI